MYIVIQQFDKRFRDIVRLLVKKKLSKHKHWHNQKLFLINYGLKFDIRKKIIFVLCILAHPQVWAMQNNK